MNIILFFFLKFRLNHFFKYDWETDSFDEMMGIVIDKEVICLTESFLCKLLNNNKIYTKKFLSSFMIKKNKSLVVSSNNKLENDLIDISNILIEIIIKIKDSKNTLEMQLHINKFNKIYKNYIEIFDLWKEHDELNIINNLSMLYFDLETDKQKRYENMDEQTNQVFIDNITIEQEKLLDKIEMISGKEGLDYLKSLKKEIDNYKTNINNLYYSIDQNIHDAYWHSIKNELIKSPPNFLIIINLLIELKEMFIKCNSNLETELNNNIDIEFIKEMLNKGVIDDKYILQMSNYIIKILRDLQCEEDNKKLDDWKIEMNEMFIKEVNYCEYFPKFFRYIFENIQITQKQIDIYNYIKQKREDNS
tara:strand:- start:801 stop:1886 length:1086 start_codon:yes stop_codon:yes gene_type:complete